MADSKDPDNEMPKDVEKEADTISADSGRAEAKELKDKLSKDALKNKSQDKGQKENLSNELENEKLANEKLAKELQEAKDKAQENWDLLLRTKAEIENVRRRTKLDIEKAHKYSVEGLAKELLHVVDSLEKGLEVSVTEENEQVNSIMQGVKLTYKLLIDTLAKFSIDEINPVGEAFDPTKHEALSMQESDEIEPNNILLVVQKGFSIYERILRPAKVIVAKPKASSMPKIDEKA